MVFPPKYHEISFITSFKYSPLDTIYPYVEFKALHQITEVYLKYNMIFPLELDYEDYMKNTMNIAFFDLKESPVVLSKEEARKKIHEEYTHNLNFIK